MLNELARCAAHTSFSMLSPHISYTFPKPTINRFNSDENFDARCQHEDGRSRAAIISAVIFVIKLQVLFNKIVLRDVRFLREWSILLKTNASARARAKLSTHNRTTTSFENRVRRNCSVTAYSIFF